MKKIIATLLALIICMGGASAFAYENGEVIGHACYTDIMAKINGYELESYNVDGATYIIARDLMHYGFDVKWDADARTVTINRSTKYITTAPDYKRAFVPQSKVGEKSFDLLHTDIVTYVKGFPVQSYNINGHTIIPFDSVAEYGGAIWIPEQKTVSIYVGNLTKRTPDANKIIAKRNFIIRARSIKTNEGFMNSSAAIYSGRYFATHNTYTDWNKLAEDMFEYLGTIMPAEDYEQLKADQQLWIEKRDAAMEEARLESGDAARYGIGNLYTSDRCYYLTSLIDADVE